MYAHSPSDADHSANPNLRVGDAEREATADRLRRNHAEGRLDVQEFQERLDRCYEATTAGQLQELVADLPRNEQRPPRHYGHRRLLWLVPIVAAVIAFSALHDGHGPHGLLILLPLFFLARLLFWRRRAWDMRGPRGGGGAQA
ncbi:MAG: hypothetical protein JWP44_5165 [Mucilaginibacter sp.]|nr:hypothetical protein [Mucilaginibacter sp.]